VKEIVQMIVVLSLICGVCAMALSGFRSATAERVENQVLSNVQGPKVKLVLEGSENDLIADRRKVTIGDQEMLLFVGKKDGKPWSIAYEAVGGGFGGDISVMVGYNLEKDALTGIQIISNKETPGIGSKIIENQFTGQFKDLEIGTVFMTKANGGEVDAVSGATYSSLGVCEALRNSVEMYDQVKAAALSQ
jgi:H+/Na+-translocating ferredoxin:NAD+ oxidoreductase subunit G